MDPEGRQHSPGGDQNPKQRRSLRSLNALTTRFVKLLQEAEGGVLDLKEVSETSQSHSTSSTYPKSGHVPSDFLHNEYNNIYT